MSTTTATVPSTRITFLDWLRCIACLMVMFVHSCEAFYFNADGDTCFLSKGDAFWATWIDSACRAAVPLFVMTSSYLLFPLTRSTGDFFKRRLWRVAVPYLVWMCIYATLHGGWGQLVFNFPFSDGHLWFVYMLIGVYLLMPLLSPWAAKVSQKELRGWILLWFFTTLFPFFRLLWGHLFGAPCFGAVPYLWGECPWNHFGAFHYVSGFFGYMLLGLYARKYLPELSWKRTLSLAAPLWLAGMAIVGGFFFAQIPMSEGFPIVRPYAFAVQLETSWEFCGFGVALTVMAYFLVIRKLTKGSSFYERIIRPVSSASYATYLMHMLVLAPLVTFLKEISLCTPVTILVTAFATFCICSVISVTLSKIPLINKLLGC